MNNTDNKSSAAKETKKVQAEKYTEENEIREDKNNSIYNEDNKTGYPNKSEADKQFENQPEFIDRNSDSKEKD